MERKETNIKKIVIGISLIIGMILAATIIAIAAFFMSTPGKYQRRRIVRHIITKSSLNASLEVEASPDANASPDGALLKLTGAKFRDPFLPPAAAWPNLKAIVLDPANDSSGRQEQIVSKVKINPSNGLKKPKTSPGKNLESKNATMIPGSAVATSNPEQQDPNSPEFKETLVLPGINQGTDKNTDAGLKIHYKVKKGETLNTVSQKFGVPAGSISKENHLNLTTDRLPEGKNLIVPILKSHLYQLKADETLWRIATRYGATVEILQDINNIKDLNKLAPGQTIILPVPATNVINKNY